MGQKWGKMGQKRGLFLRQIETPKSPETLYFQGFEAFLIHTSHMQTMPAVGSVPFSENSSKIKACRRFT